MAAPTAPKKPAKTRPASGKREPMDEVAEEVAASAPPDIVVTFRGQQFSIPRERLAGFHFGMALGSNNGAAIMFELLGELDSARCLALVQRGEQFEDVFTEFTDAFREATGPGNS